ncbi:DUF4153 domain-containing protein [Halomonas dongshanensis]|uniref:DUF4153 domain-containing protein n=1 Tax=Halomonas dongshanensis TaxID=2890835 RepID=A0ABT2ED76_9GAMM|nr:DUF4153 domain-containing protein [Halomonas dongshanensis]MCS2609541.1 DUF4153 domain-containing protein [Halomonas dongshanensis]
MDQNALTPDRALHDKPTRIALVLIAIFQGVALLLLHLAITHEHGLATDARWLKALYTVSLGLPAVYLLGMVRLQERITALPLLLAPLLFWLGWHLGWVEQDPHLESVTRHTFTFSYGVSLGVALFILALFFRCRAAGGNWSFSYPALLTTTWEFVLTLSQLGLFIGVFWGLLWLWATLFDAIGLSFLHRLFTQPAFAYPTTWLVIGLTLTLIRRRFGLINSVRHMGETLIKALLPLVALIIVMFLGVLPFTGLQPIWDTGRTSAILMMLTFTLLLFFNAIFYTATDLPYSLWLRRFIWLAILLLPFASLLAASALWLRIDQYGLSLDRLWAALLQLLIAAFTLSYSLLLIWRRSAALPAIQQTNISLALVVAGALIAINTPLADMRHFAAQHQVQRLLAGETSTAAFDVEYLRFQLGQPGIQALETLLESDFLDAHPALARRVELSLKKAEPWSQEPLVDTLDLNEVAQQFTTAANSSPLPAALLEALASQPLSCLSSTELCRAEQITDEPRFQWLIFEPFSASGLAYANAPSGWQLIGTLLPLGSVQPQDEHACLRREAFTGMQPVTGLTNVYENGACLYHLQPTLERARQALEGRPLQPVEE